MNNRMIAVGLGVVVLAMLGLAFASKPLYDTFCRVTGFGGTTQIAEEAPAAIIDRALTVRFDANVMNAPVLFRPLQTSMQINLGEHGLAFYEVTNTSDHDVSLMASYNVTPHKAGLYFSKLECFCFEERIIQAGETKKLPIVYFIDPALDEERNMQDVRTITLSYTFYETDSFEGAANSAALN
ncbi:MULTISPECIES: cytochrome c oxidase assembly protein [Henriciella]|uniref:Cytochrome c oxidase assembly protein CtaG n=1 Tax=Henriciella pelagia TaxID=1977912 RepID=A0ABQ1J615_9PROT|nr:cytochrome c oxidase assembly protein [Henriciella pelagia]GGB60485.1 cytochrome c oxidase assembly protein CtaG [Henriciella pelagia]